MVVSCCNRLGIKTKKENKQGFVNECYYTCNVLNGSVNRITMVYPWVLHFLGICS